MTSPLRANWLDQWRLLFAGLVLLSHSFGLTGHPDPLASIGAPTDLGKLAVAGFLIVSGYLISKAWDRSATLADYLRSRLLRIGPGFAVAFVLSVTMAVLAGGSAEWSKLPLELFTLHQPSARFPTAENFQANAAMWTIQLEFVCYLIAPLISRRRSLLIAWSAAAGLTLLSPGIIHISALASWWLRGALMFLSGACYYRFGFTARRLPLLLCAGLLPVLLVTPEWALGMALAGGYLLLSLGLQERRVSPWVDISYGVYLYGWPLQKLLVLAGVNTPWTMFPAAAALALASGALSWKWVERPSLALLRRSPRPEMRLRPAD